MRLKFSDLKQMMQYAEKEKPEIIAVEEDNFKTHFSFTDSEGRNCKVTIFESTANTTPELTKNMKLYTRLKETKKQGDDNE